MCGKGVLLVKCPEDENNSRGQQLVLAKNVHKKWFHFLVLRAVAYFRCATVARGGALPLPMENIDPPPGGEATAAAAPKAGLTAAPPKPGVPNGD